MLTYAAGIKPELIDTDVHAKEKLAHYARACTGSLSCMRP
jgi:glycyl-tRNA synthetase (class II)